MRCNKFAIATQSVFDFFRVWCSVFVHPTRRRSGPFTGASTRNESSAPREKRMRQKTRKRARTVQHHGHHCWLVQLAFWAARLCTHFPVADGVSFLDDVHQHWQQQHFNPPPRERLSQIRGHRRHHHHHLQQQRQSYSRVLRRHRTSTTKQTMMMMRHSSPYTTITKWVTSGSQFFHMYTSPNKIPYNPQNLQKPGGNRHHHNKKKKKTKKKNMNTGHNGGMKPANVGGAGGKGGSNSSNGHGHGGGHQTSGGGSHPKHSPVYTLAPSRRKIPRRTSRPSTGHSGMNPTPSTTTSRPTRDGHPATLGPTVAVNAPGGRNPITTKPSVGSGGSGGGMHQRTSQPSVGSGGSGGMHQRTSKPSVASGGVGGMNQQTNKPSRPSSIGETQVPSGAIPLPGSLAPTQAQKTHGGTYQPTITGSAVSPGATGSPVHSSGSLAPTNASPGGTVGPTTVGHTGGAGSLVPTMTGGGVGGGGTSAPTPLTTGGGSVTLPPIGVVGGTPVPTVAGSGGGTGRTTTRPIPTAGTFAPSPGETGTPGSTSPPTIPGGGMHRNW